MKLRGLLGFAAADQNLITVTIFMQLLLEKKKKKLWATDKKGTGLIQEEERHKIQKLEERQNSKGIITPIPLAEDRKKPPLQNTKGITVKMHNARHLDKQSYKQNK